MASKAAFALGAQAVRRLVWARAMYHDGRSRGQKHGTAIRRVARSLLRILCAMLRNGTSYDEAHYVRVLQAKGVEWAMSLQLPSPCAPIAQTSP